MSTTNAETSGPRAASWEQAASRIADELRQAPLDPRMAKVSSLLHTFRSQGVHCEIQDMLHALRAHGVNTSPEDSEISRRHVLELRLKEKPAASDASAPTDDGIRVSLWRSDKVGRPERLDGDSRVEDDTDAVRWFDVDPGDGEPSAERVHQVTTLLKERCSGLNEMIVRDLLTPDVEPKSEIYGDELTAVRKISVPALVAREVPDDDDDFDGIDEQLVVQIVEIVVGPGWMLTCWHSSRTLIGGGEVEIGPPLLHEPFLSHVEHRWLHDETAPFDADSKKEANDLAVYLARSLVATYGASLRMLQRWVSSWEVGFYKTLGENSPRRKLGDPQERKSLKDAAAEISNFLAIGGEFSRSVNTFRLAGDEMPNETWFADPDQRELDTGERILGEQAKALESAVDAAAEKLAHLYEEIRADMDLLMIQSQARQQESSERLQGYLGKVTGLILVPTFVAGLFGANTALPGQGSWSGFDLMLILMVVSAAASYWVIRRLMA